ncbi:MAG TPA: polyprenyl synthetase family protein, partial [Thermomicrobiaceae bacterium]|nr:polyprenyl synthetase family protein [Thermomicrobiaceae bacterium]
VVRVFASTLADICDGELSELFSAHQTQQSIDDYRRRIFGKTASLFAGSAEMGAILAGADDLQIDILRRFGCAIGMAFQIVDDVLDLRQDTADIGKPAGLDLRQGTVTLPTMLFLENGGNDHEKDFIRGLFNGDQHNDAEFDAAVDVIRGSGAIEHAIEMAEEYVDEARRLLESIPAGEARNMLTVLADLSLSLTF